MLARRQLWTLFFCTPKRFGSFFYFFPDINFIQCLFIPFWGPWTVQADCNSQQIWCSSKTNLVGLFFCINFLRRQCIFSGTTTLCSMSCRDCPSRQVSINGTRHSCAGVLLVRIPWQYRSAQRRCSKKSWILDRYHFKHRWNKHFFSSKCWKSINFIGDN